MLYYNKKEYPKQIWVSQIPEREVSLLRENLAEIKQTTFVLMKKDLLNLRKEVGDTDEKYPEMQELLEKYYK